MLYHLYEANRFMAKPLNYLNKLGEDIFTHPSPLSLIPGAQILLAANSLAQRITKDYPKPEWGIPTTKVGDHDVPVIKSKILSKTFCDLTLFTKHDPKASSQPNILLIAPLSGHYATLLRDTVKSLVAHHNVYVTEWKNSRDVPLSQGLFTLDDYIAYLWDFIKTIGPNSNLVAVCQPAVPALIITALMSEANDPNTPRTMTLMGGPIDTRINPTVINKFATSKSLQWFEDNLIQVVPTNYAGAGRRVYPGFMQLGGFISMNWSEHAKAYMQYFNSILHNDEFIKNRHIKFYDEYLAATDMDAPYFLQTIDSVFHKFDLPKNKAKWKNKKVNLKAIEKTALLTIEGELDDISGLGQTQAAHGLCSNIKSNMKKHHLEEGVGHYGIFSGKKWRNNISNVIKNFIIEHNRSL